MPTPLFPPRGLFIGTRWLFDPLLAPAPKETLLQLMTLAWSTEAHTTPLLTYAFLTDITGKSARTLRGHLLELRHYHAALRFQRADARQFTIILADWLFRNTAPASHLAGERLSADEGGKSLPHPVKEEEEVKEFQDPENDLLLLLPDPDHDLDPYARGENGKSLPGGRKNIPVPVGEETEMTMDDLLDEDVDVDVLPPVPTGFQPDEAPGQAAAAASARRSMGRAGGRLPEGRDVPPDGAERKTRRAKKAEPLSEEVQEHLRAAEVFPALFAEISTRAKRGGYADGDLIGLLDWCRTLEPDHPAALFVGRLRAGARAPAEFTQPICPRCGKRGGHERHCPRSYAIE